MVDSTGYIPTPDNKTWKTNKKWEWSSPKKGKHAEIQGWEELVTKSPTGVYMFVQTACPCEDCFPKFRGVSGGGTISIIFIITRAGYQIDGSVHLNTAALGAAPAFVVPGSALRPNSYPVPVALYFFDGQAYLSAQPGRFPAHPSVIPYLT